MAFYHNKLVNKPPGDQTCFFEKCSISVDINFPFGESYAGFRGCGTAAVTAKKIKAKSSDMGWLCADKIRLTKCKFQHIEVQKKCVLKKCKGIKSYEMDVDCRADLRIEGGGRFGKITCNKADFVDITHSISVWARDTSEIISSVFDKGVLEKGGHLEGCGFKTLEVRGGKLDYDGWIDELILDFRGSAASDTPEILLRDADVKRLVVRPRKAGDVVSIWTDSGCDIGDILGHTKIRPLEDKEKRKEKRRRK